MLLTLGGQYRKIEHLYPGAFAIAFCAIAALLTPQKAVAQSLSVEPDADTIFVFSGFQGGPFLPETPTIWTLDNAQAQPLEFSVSSNQPWLLVAPATGQLPGSLVLERTREVEAVIDSVDASQLMPGVYTARVRFVNATNNEGTTERTVRLNVAAANFSVSPSFVNASAIALTPSPPPVAVRLQSNGNADLSYRLSWTPRSWFTVDKTSGTVPGGGSETFNVLFNTVGLLPGVYTGSITIENLTNGVGNREVPVNLVVQSGTAGAVVLRPDQDLQTVGPEHAIPPVTQVATLTNNGEGIVLWTSDSGEDWVSVTPSGGQLAPTNAAAGGPDEQLIEIRVNSAANNLEPGSHVATVSFENVTGGLGGSINIGSRVVYVEVRPVLHLGVALTGGSVVASPPGQTVAGGSSSDLVVDFGEIVTLTVQLEDGFAFQGWAADFHLDDELENPLVVTMDKSRSVSAIVVPIDRTLSLSTSGTGTGIVKVTPTGSTIDNDLVSSYKTGTQVSISAVPDAGSVFVGWAGNVPEGQEKSNPLTVVMDTDRTITARFETSVTLTVESSPGGSVSIEPDLESYGPGSTVTLTAVPEDGFVFAGWSGGISGTQEEITIVLSDNLSISALFEPAGNGGGGDGSPRLIVDIEGDGVVTPPGGTYQRGARVTLIATPGVNSVFSHWEGDATGTDLLTTIVMDDDREVRAVFEAGDGLGNEPPGDRPTPGLTGACGALGTVGVFLFALASLGLRLQRRRVSVFSPQSDRRNGV